MKSDLQLALLRAGITQEQIAKETGKTKGTVSLVLTGKYQNSYILQKAKELIDKRELAS